MPASVDFFNNVATTAGDETTIDERLAEFEREAAKVGLKYPVLCKL